MSIKPGALRFNTDSMKLEIFRGSANYEGTASMAGIGPLAAGQWEEIQATSPEAQTGGTRGVIGGGNNPAYLTDIEFVTISSTGNATDYGDLTDSRGSLTALASRTRAVFACGYSPGDVNTIDFITIASGGTAQDFGDNTASGNNGARYAPSGLSNSTRGLIGGLEGVLVPAGTSSVYDQNLGKNVKRPFLHVRYRASEADDRKLKTWITGSLGGASSSGTDKMEVHYLSERCLVVQAANNFVRFDS